MTDSSVNNRTIFHVDVNSAFLSWSAVKRLQEDPSAVDLRTIPSAVGGDAETRHGIITAKSIPAKKYGIHTAMTVAEAMRLCPDLVLVPGDFAVYRKFSKQFIDILKGYTDLVEQASIDEAYMDVTGTEELYREYETEEYAFPLSLAHHIRSEIKKTLGFTVNIGVSTNKLLAKMASDFEKPDRVHTLYPEEVPAKMWPLPVGDLFGCGARTAEKLASYGVRTIGDAAAMEETWLKQILGDKAGAYIWRSANGKNDRPVEAVREEAKSVSNEITLAKDLVESNYNIKAPKLIHSLSESVARRLREKGLFGQTVVVSVKTADFRRKSRQAPLPGPTDSGVTIEKAAMGLLHDLCFGEGSGTEESSAATAAGRGGRRAPLARPAQAGGLFGRNMGVRLVGVGVTNISHGENRQMSIFDFDGAEGISAGEAEKGEKDISLPGGKMYSGRRRQQNLDAMEDAINGKFGEGTLKRGLS